MLGAQLLPNHVFSSSIDISLDKDRIGERYNEAQTALLKNIWKLPQFDKPVLSTGVGYPGIYLEHNQDNLFLAKTDIETALAGHEIFFKHQREDGLLPAAIIDINKYPLINDPPTGIAFASVHAVVPPAYTAWKLAKLSQREAFLQQAYSACSRYDAWLVKKRNRKGTGLVEMYCEYDTGGDKQRRVIDGGLKGRCPGNDACNMPDLEIMPIVSVDLSAMMYGSRVALSQMATALGKTIEAQQWLEKSEYTKKRIHELCYDPEDQFFYDVDGKGQFRKYRTEHITKLFITKVVDQKLFDIIYNRYFKNPKEFATPFPFPSVSISDPTYNTDAINSWCGPSQTLTAIRTTLWMEDYGKHDDFMSLAKIWVDAICKSDLPFTQEMNPITGKFSDVAQYYTPSLLMFIDFVDRLNGGLSVSDLVLK